MRSVTARGTGREIGRALGEEARRSVRDQVFESETFHTLQRWAGTDRLAAIMVASQDACPGYFEEVIGIAEGVGAPVEDIFLWNCRGDLPPPGRDPEGCTSLMFPPHGEEPALIAHNEDGAAELEGCCFMARVEPDNGLGFDTFCYPGMLPGHSFAMNDAGLVQTINNISPHDLSTGVSRHLVCRAILGCNTLEEALGWLRRGDRASGFHHNLGSAREAALASVEAPASGCVASPVAAPRAHANHLCFPEFFDRPQTVSPSSEERQRRADALLTGAEDALSILFDRARPDLPILCRGEAETDRAYTLATAVFRLDCGGVSMDVFHGPSRSPVFSASSVLAPAT